MHDRKSQKSVTKEAAKKKDRAQYRCKTEVKKLIALVNSIPPDRKLPHRKQIVRDLNGDHIKAMKRLKTLLGGAPPDFIRKSGGIWGAYVKFRNLRRALRDMANLALVPAADRQDYLSLQNRLLSDPDFEKDLSDEERTRVQRFKLCVRDWGETTEEDIEPGVTFPNAPSFRVDLTIGADGKIEADAWSQIEALIGIQADRLRVCAFCLQIFWARQSNMVGCGGQCSVNNRMRLYRERHAQYEQAREKKRRK